MDVTREYLDAQIAAATARLEQLRADVNAHLGAIQAWRAALAQLDTPAPVLGPVEWHPSERSTTSHDQRAVV
jgi:hypothetical protein